MAWIEECVRQNFVMPIAEYTLDETDVNTPELRCDSAQGAGNTSNESITVVGHESPKAHLATSKAKDAAPQKLEFVQRDEQKAPVKIMQTSKKVIKGQLTSGKRPRSRSPSQSPTSPPKKKTKSQRSPTTKPPLSPKTRMQIKKELTSPPRNRPVAVLPSTGNRKLITFHTQQTKLKTPLPAHRQVLWDAQGNISDPLKEFFDSVPQGLRESPAFRKVLCTALDMAAAQSKTQPAVVQVAPEGKAFVPASTSKCRPYPFVPNQTVAAERVPIPLVPVERFLRARTSSPENQMVEVDFGTKHEGRTFRSRVTDIRLSAGPLKQESLDG